MRTESCEHSAALEGGAIPQRVQARCVTQEDRQHRMSVCMLTYSFYESDGRVIRYAEALAARGDRVDVLALRREGASREETLNGVNVLRMQRRRRNRNGQLYYAFGVMLFFVRAMLLLSGRHLRHRYQLIHVHSVPDFLVFAAWLPKLMGAKIVLDIHDLLPELYAGKYESKVGSLKFKCLLAVERVSARFADHVIAANDLWQQRLATRSVNSDKCTALVNVPNPEIFRREGRSRSDGKFVMIYPGTLNWHQGLDIAVRAFALITDEIPEAEFHIYGEGHCHGVLAALIEALMLTDKVLLKGFLPIRSVARAIENADLGIVPKRNEGFGNEAFSTKIMEFMSLGVPVIVTDTAVDRYYFSDSLVKFFRSGSEGDLAEAVVTLYRDEGLRRTLVKNALEFVASNNWDVMKTRYFALVDSLAGQPRGSESIAQSVSS